MSQVLPIQIQDMQNQRISYEFYRSWLALIYFHKMTFLLNYLCLGIELFLIVSNGFDMSLFILLMGISGIKLLLSLYILVQMDDKRQVLEFATALNKNITVPPEYLVPIDFSTRKLAQLLTLSAIFLDNTVNNGCQETMTCHFTVLIDFYNILFKRKRLLYYGSSFFRILEYFNLVQLMTVGSGIYSYFVTVREYDIQLYLNIFIVVNLFDNSIFYFEQAFRIGSCLFGPILFIIRLLQNNNDNSIKNYDQRIQPEFKGFLYIPGKTQGETLCAICLGDFQKGDTLITLKCNPLHHFHIPCIKMWLHSRNNCPLCRFHFINKEYFADPVEQSEQNEQNQNNQEVNRNQPQYDQENQRGSVNEQLQPGQAIQIN